MDTWGVVRGVRVRICVCVSFPTLSPLPRPSPNLGSDVAPSYSTFPCVSFASHQSPGRPAGEAAHPRGYCAQGGAGRGGGGSPGSASPFPPPLARGGRRGARREAPGPGLVRGQLAPPASRLSVPFPPPRRAGPGSGPDLGPGAGALLCPGPLSSSHLWTPGHSQA